MVATIRAFSHICFPASAFALLTLAALPAGLRAEETTAEESLFVTVRNPITSEEFSRVKSVTSAARDRYHKAGQKGRLKIVYDFNPDHQPSSTSLFGPCLDLADYILSLNDITTVAFVHRDVSRHTVLPVLACQEIVMAPGDDVHLGNVLPDAADQPPIDIEQFYKDRRVQSYQDVAKQRGRCPAVVLKMLDKNMDVLEGTRPEGSIWYFDKRRLKDENVAAVRNEPILPAGNAGFYGPALAQKFGLCKRQLKTRQDVAQAYEMPDSSLREDPLEGRSPVAWRIEVRGALTKALEEGVKRHINRVIGQGANFLIIQLDCGGGDPIVAQELANYLSTLRDTTGRFPVMTVAYVTEQARDHSVFLALGCSEIVIDKRAKLGDYEHFLQTKKPGDPAGVEIARSLSDLAQKRDYSPVLARALLDPDLVVYRAKARNNPAEKRYLSEDDLHDDQRGEQKWVEPVLVKEKGRLLVLGGDQAVKYGFARHAVENVDQLYERYGLLRQQVRVAGPDWLDRFAQFLQQPVVSVMLVMLGIAMLILELKLPGVGLPGVLSALCFLLFFWSHSQLAFFWLAVLLFILGLVLIALEIFVTPGLAVLGASGVVLVLAGLGLATMERWPQTESEWVATAGTMGQFGVGLVGAVFLAVIVARYLPNIPYANRLVLVPPADRVEDVADETAHVEAARRAGLLGAIGVAATTLRPSGMVRFGDEYLDVVAEGSYVEPGTRVQVIEIEGNRIVVKEV